MLGEMNADGQTAWSPAPGGPEEDFNFLDFNDVDLSFSHGDGMNDGHGHAHTHTHVHSQGGHAAVTEAMELTHHAFSPDLDTSQMSTPVSTAFPSGDSLAEMAMQQQMFHQQMQHQHGQHHVHQPQTSGASGQPVLRSQPGQQAHYYRQGMVPPTPNTVEMQGAQVHAFTDSQALGMYEAGKHQDQMVFTPLVSPAFQMQEYSTPSEYFSPLTSPALQAQEYSRQALPGNPHLENEKKDAVGTSLAARKPKRRPASTKDPVPAVRSSPAMKAQQKRYSASSKTPKEIAEVVAGLGALQQHSPAVSAIEKSSALQSKTNSETGSISPEPLSEVLMPPPAAPRSGSQGKSAQSSPHTLQGKVPGGGASPATPSSLFKVSKPNEAGSIATREKNGSRTPQPQPLNTAVGKRSAPTTPHMAAQDANMGNTTPTSATSRTISSAPASAPLASPQIPELGSPAVSVPPSALIDQPANKNNKKRSSSSHVSPALRPRISPSIKPLLPGGPTMDSETTALLLANKSNYERIIDGSASQLGVNFPAQLSENLTSKRTSHKLAEQGRRNRINTALQEIQTLIPESIGRDSGDIAGNGSNASKAKTVENAISYIRLLQSELQQAKTDLTTAHQKLAVLSTTSSQESESSNGTPPPSDSATKSQS